MMKKKLLILLLALTTCGYVASFSACDMLLGTDSQSESVDGGSQESTDTGTEEGNKPSGGDENKPSDGGENKPSGGDENKPSDGEENKPAEEEKWEESTQETAGLRYTLSVDKSYYIVSGYEEGEEEEVYVPSKHDGKAVKEIADYAFREKNMRKVYLPDCVEKIGEDSFASCELLTEVRLGKGLQTIGGGAFYCTALTAISLPNSVVSVGEAAFKGCYMALSLSLGKSVATVENDAFGSCPVLTIDVHAENTHFTAIDGNLYTKDGTVLIKYATGKTDTSFTLPQTVTKIGACAFAECASLETVTLGANVEVIDECAFDFCENLYAVTIPAKVHTIGYGAFNGCERLASAVFETQLGWKIAGEAVDGRELNDPAMAAGLLLNRTGEWKREVGGPEVVLTYTLSADNSYYIVTDLEAIVFADVVIESVHEGLPVKEIGEFAFYENYQLAGITIPASITRIGESAFYGCIHMQNAVFEKTTGWYGSGFSGFFDASLLNDPYQAAEALKAFDGTLYWQEEEGFPGENLPGENIPDETFPEEGKDPSLDYDAPYTSEGLMFELASDGNYYVVVYSPNAKGNIEIPAEHEGFPVKGIREGAFGGCAELTGIIIPGSISKIGGKAFVGCAYLKNVTIEYGVEIIGEGAFGFCPIEQITIPESVTLVGSAAFDSCEKLESVTVEMTEGKIERMAFYNCEGLKRLSFTNKTGWTIYDEPVTESLIADPVAFAAYVLENQCAIVFAK